MVRKSSKGGRGRGMTRNAEQSERPLIGEMPFDATEIAIFVAEEIRHAQEYMHLLQSLANQNSEDRSRSRDLMLSAVRKSGWVHGIYSFGNQFPGVTKLVESRLGEPPLDVLAEIEYHADYLSEGYRMWFERFGNDRDGRPIKPR